MSRALYSALYVLILVGWICPIDAQHLSGTILDEDSQPMPYVSIYVKNSTKGTVSNPDGAYLLKLEPGHYEIAYQFIGYKTEVRSIDIVEDNLIEDVQLKLQSTLLSEVIIAADREDPAYAIIRQAISKRNYYKNLNSNYKCNVYVKGNQKILKAPEKILGVEVGDMDGMLDSTRKGIVYLSESVSELFVNGNEYKEVITSSKISGNDRGYSFNSAKAMEFSFYNNTIELQRQMVSPIASNALNYYKYRLEGVFQDDEGRLINKIQVIPKRSNDPSFYGTLYIVDQLWNIHSLKLGATAASTQVYFVDSLTFNQVYVPVEEPDKWAIFSNTISFNLGAFGFELKGFFTGVYSNYTLNPEVEEDFFNEIVHLVEPSSNERDSLFWLDVRPVPLTEEEVVDYHRKDSIHEVRNDPVYMDSVDQKNNKFGVGDFVSTYSYTRRSKRFYYTIGGPLSNIHYNTVQGYNASLVLDARKYYDEAETRRVLFGVKANYGFSEEKVRLSGYITYRPSRINYHQFSLSGGSKVVQFNRDEPITAFLNTAYTLLNRVNHAKWLGLKNIRMAYSTEPFPGLFLTGAVNWEERRPLVNNSDISFFRKEERVFASNDPRDILNNAPSFDIHQAFIIDLNATIRFKQKYVLYPDRRFNAGSKGPALRLSYTGAFQIGGTDIAYQKIAASLNDEWNVGVGGRFEWYLNGGIFFDKERIEFRDYRHFMGSEIFLMKGPDYSRTFLQLPYYSYSTPDKYFQVHIQHHFDGYILDKIPAIQKLGWSLIGGVKFLKAGDLPSYTEYHLGLDNIGFKFIRLIRIDGVLSVSDGRRDWGVRMSVGIN